MTAIEPADAPTIDQRHHSALGRLRAAISVAPRYEPSAADLRTISIAGLVLPMRATVALLVATTVVSLDWSRTFIPRIVLDLNRAPEALLYQGVERVVLFGFVPLAVVLLVFRDRPARYGLQLGDWRFGAPAAILGIAIMSPVVIALAAQPDFRAFYAPSVASPQMVLTTNLVDLPATEFLIRGFLMFTLLRVIGPSAVIVSTLPFVFSHLSKPEIELLSTFFGGVVYGWLDWRTRSIAWSAAAHVAIVTILLLAVGSASPR